MIHKIRTYFPVVVLATLFRVSYGLVVTLLPNRALIRFIGAKYNRARMGRGDQNPARKDLILKQAGAVMHKLYPGTKCLLRAIVTNEILIAYGYKPEKINIGVKKDGDHLYAHAWIVADHSFKKICEL